METRNLCAQIPVELHEKVTTARDEKNLTMAQYMTELLTDYFTNPKFKGDHSVKESNYHPPPQGITIAPCTKVFLQDVKRSDEDV